MSLECLPDDLLANAIALLPKYDAWRFVSAASDALLEKMARDIAFEGLWNDEDGQFNELTVGKSTWQWSVYGDFDDERFGYLISCRDAFIDEMREVVASDELPKFRVCLDAREENTTLINRVPTIRNATSLKLKGERATELLVTEVITKTCVRLATLVIDWSRWMKSFENAFAESSLSKTLTHVEISAGEWTVDDAKACNVVVIAGQLINSLTALQALKVVSYRCHWGEAAPYEASLRKNVGRLKHLALTCMPCLCSDPPETDISSYELDAIVENIASERKMKSLYLQNVGKLTNRELQVKLIESGVTRGVILESTLNPFDAVFFQTDF